MTSPIFTGSNYIDSVTLTIQGNIYLKLKEYKIYWDKGTGEWELFDTVPEDGRIYYNYKTKSLDPGTYSFKINPVDIYENELDSIVVKTATIHGIPQPPTNIQITNFQGNKITFSYELSKTPIVTEYRLYGNTGTGDDVNFNNILSTSTTSSITTPVLSEGHWKFVIRAFDGLYEDNNITSLTEVFLAGTPLEIVTPPPRKIVNLIGQSYQGGRAKLTFTVNNRLGYKAKYAYIYQDLNFTNKIDTIELSATTDIITKTWVSEPYVGSRKWTVRLASGTSDYSEEKNTDYVEVIAYPFPPPEVKNFQVAVTF